MSTVSLVHTDIRGRLRRNRTLGCHSEKFIAKDIRDVRSFSGSQYNRGMRVIIRYYERNFPELMKKGI